MPEPNSDGVFLTDAEKSQSRENKKRHRTITQLPVYRNAVMLLDVIVDITAKSPRNLRKFTDSSFEMVNELMRYIGLAQEYRNEERIVCITEAISFVFVLKTHFAIYQRRGIIAKDLYNKIRALCDNTVAQLVGWRDSVRREGSESS